MQFDNVLVLLHFGTILHSHSFVDVKRFEAFRKHPDSVVTAKHVMFRRLIRCAPNGQYTLTATYVDKEINGYRL